MAALVEKGNTYLLKLEYIAMPVLFSTLCRVLGAYINKSVLFNAYKPVLINAYFGPPIM